MSPDTGVRLSGSTPAAWNAYRPGSVGEPGRYVFSCTGEGSGDLAPPPGRWGAGRGRLRPGRAQPISSRALPFVSFTNFRTNGMESAANTV